ncbi:hypothetical protein N5D61_05110 [Pseudomonas sp. GD03842]|uniref:hypothetical protein n=1 Tax=Pseudomonas sp. GD03842 TaxID=2975385 RepID=UPI00244AC7E4|nr:hypothetical protein [Pseudomonas sp. GD03842]MDH0745718.1 hypothetical protein [Pseudomonas sp. GD03842]
MDAKSRLIQKITEKNQEELVTASRRQHLLDSFKKDLSELHAHLRNIVEDIPGVTVSTLPSRVDDVVFDDGSFSIELFGNEMTFNVAHDANRFGVKVGNLWRRDTFLVAERKNLWSSPARTSEPLFLSDNEIFDKLSEFVDSPVEKGVHLWD